MSATHRRRPAPFKRTQPSSRSFHTSIMKGAREFSLEGVNFNNVGGDQHNTHNGHYSTTKDSYNRQTTNNRNQYKNHHYRRDFRANSYASNNSSGQYRRNPFCTPERYPGDDLESDSVEDVEQDEYEDFDRDSEELDCYEEEQESRRYDTRRGFSVPRRAQASSRNRLLIEQSDVVEPEQRHALEVISSHNKVKGRSRGVQQDPEHTCATRRNVPDDKPARAYASPPLPTKPSASKPSSFISRPPRASNSSGSQFDRNAADISTTNLSERKSDTKVIETKAYKPRELVRAPSTPSRAKGSSPRNAASTTVPSTKEGIVVVE